MAIDFEAAGLDPVVESTPVDNTPNLPTNPDTGTPSPKEFSDNDFVKVPGMTEPVKYGDLYKRLQADHTKKTTEAANLRAQYEREKQDWARQKQTEENNLKQLIAATLNRSRQGNGQGDFLSKLQSMQYLDGPTAAALFKEIQEGGFGSINTAIQERDQVIKALYGQVANLAKTVQGMNGQYTNQNFDTRMGSVVKELGLPPEAKTLAKELYLAYEGDDLESEFPTILQNRWDEIVGIIRAQDKARVSASKNRPFPLAGKGGQGTPSKQVQLLKGNETSKQTADVLWDLIQSDDES